MTDYQPAFQLDPVQRQQQPIDLSAFDPAEAIKAQNLVMQNRLNAMAYKDAMNRGELMNRIANDPTLRLNSMNPQAQQQDFGTPPPQNALAPPQAPVPGPVQAQPPNAMGWQPGAGMPQQPQQPQRPQMPPGIMQPNGMIDVEKVPPHLRGAALQYNMQKRDQSISEEADLLLKHILPEAFKSKSPQKLKFALDWAKRNPKTRQIGENANIQDMKFTDEGKLSITGVFNTEQKEKLAQEIESSDASAAEVIRRYPEGQTLDVERNDDGKIIKVKPVASADKEKDTTNAWIAESQERDAKGQPTAKALKAKANLSTLADLNKQKIQFGIDVRRDAQNNVSFNPRQQQFIDQQVRALVEDRTTPSFMRQAMATGGMGLAAERQAISQEIWNRVYQERPNYDTTAAEANYKGKTNALAINRVQLAKTVIPIADTVIALAKKIPSGIGFVPADEFKRKLGRYLNNEELIKLEFNKNKMVEEFERMLTGSQMADSRVQRNLDLVRTGYEPKAIAYLAEETKKIANTSVSAVGSPMYSTDKAKDSNYQPFDVKLPPGVTAEGIAAELRKRQKR